MQQRHLNRRQYFQEQAATTRKYVLPYIAAVKPITKNTRVLEIGCGEGGNLVPFVEIGCPVVGVDINAGQIERAREYLAEQFPKTQPVLLAGDIYEVDPAMIGQFDVVMLRDVIEHIPDQDRFFKHVRSYLQPAGVIFFGFPPWYMPFGGHQQVCHSKFLSKLPWFHLLPSPLFLALLKAFGESPHTIQSLQEVKDTGIGISRFKRLVQRNGYNFARKTIYLINPNYEMKFGLKPRIQNSFISKIPLFRDFCSTCFYGVVEEKKVNL